MKVIIAPDWLTKKEIDLEEWAVKCYTGEANTLASMLGGSKMDAETRIERLREQWDDLQRIRKENGLDTFSFERMKERAKCSAEYRERRM